MTAPAPRVLAVRLSSLGDVILSTPVYRALKAAWPGCRVSVLVKERFAEALRACPDVDEVLVFETRGFFGWLLEIRRRGFDVYVDLHATGRSRAWGLFSGIPRRVRYDKRAGARRALVLFKARAASLSGTVTDRYLECLAPLGVPPAGRRPEIRAEASRDPRFGDGPLIGLAPGAQHAIKRWPAERFAEAADRLAARWNEVSSARGEPRVVLLGAPSDAPAAERVLASLRAPALNLAGRTTLGEMFAVIRRCSLFLTNDSGAMHAAAALGVPTVAVFGPTVREFGFFPPEGGAAVVERPGLYCRPCSLHGADDCPEGHFRCMKEIPADEVAATAARVLRGDGAR